MPPPVIGTNGGTVTEATGAEVIFPAGAVTADTTFRIAMDSTGAPPLPAGLVTAGNTYVITPHGGDFEQPVEVRIPAPTVTLQPNQEFKLAKAEPGGEWVVLDDTELTAGNLSVEVNNFSFFRAVVVTYRLPIVEAEPFRVGALLECDGGSCDRVFGTVNATFTVTSNNGQLPENCNSPVLGIFAGNSLSYSSGVGPTIVPITGGSLARVVPQTNQTTYRFGVGRRCGSGQLASWAQQLNEKTITWARPPQYPNLAVMTAPATLDIVEGMPANLDIVFGGGASRSADEFNRVSATNRTVIDWERSDNNGASWHVIARSYENEANPWPYTAHEPWFYWSVRHAFTGTITDQGALIRAHACYAPEGVEAPPCVTSPATRLNVLQQSALPTIGDAPRSVLVRTGQTANLSVTATGLPAPTLRWQSRPANSSGAWSDVTGVSANTANYTTAPMTLADNGVQFRAVATNSLGEATSIGATVSVSDLDEVPAITTQPGSLVVTAGSDAVFAVVASGTEALSYQWRFNGAPLAGANSPVLRLTGVTVASAGSYSVTVSNDAGEADSDAAMLNVTAGTPAAVAPTVVTQPSAATVTAGNTATFAVGVDGTGPFTFQWRRDGANIVGATSAVITLNNVALPNAGAYSVVVSNSAGTIVSSNAILSVAEGSGALPPGITTQPATLIIPAGGSGFMAVGATGSGPLSYQWSFNGTAIPGATLPVLSLTSVSGANVGNYTVTVTNSLASATSQVASVILLGAPAITQQPAAVTAVEGSTATFNVTADGSALRYQWLLNGQFISGADQASYTTPMLVSANSGAVYSVIVYNSAGLVASQSAVLTVNVVVAPTVLLQPVNMTVQAGQIANICMAFGGTAPFQVEFSRWLTNQWTVIGSPVVNDNSETCISSPNLQLADSGSQFRFIAVNPAGNVMTNIVTITVVSPPLLTATTLVSVALNANPANNVSNMPSMSADGALVAFTSLGTNLVAGVTTSGTESGHAYLRNLATGVTTLINQTPAGAPSDRGVVNLKLSSGGRYAVFTSLAGDLVTGDTNNSLDVFRRDFETGTTVRLNLLPNGDQITGAGNGVGDLQLDISADGRYVIFLSVFDLVTDGSPNAGYFLYYLDVASGFRRLVAGSPSYGVAYSAMSDNGEWVAYAYGIPAPANQTVNLHDTEANVTYDLYSFEQNIAPAGLRQGISISSDGRYVAFAMNSAALLGGSSASQVVVLDRENPGTFTVASTGANGMGDGNSAWPELSGDGRYVLFSTIAPNLTSAQAMANRPFVMVHDGTTANTYVASRRPNGTDVWAGTFVNGNHAFSRDGTALAFVADYNNVSGGTFGDQIFATPRP